MNENDFLSRNIIFLNFKNSRRAQFVFYLCILFDQKFKVIKDFKASLRPQKKMNLKEKLVPTYRDKNHLFLKLIKYVIIQQPLKNCILFNDKHKFGTT